MANSTLVAAVIAALQAKMTAAGYSVTISDAIGALSAMFDTTIGPVQTNSNGSYIVLGNGVKIAWRTLTVGSTGNQSAVMPVTFTNTPFCVGGMTPFNNMGTWTVWAGNNISWNYNSQYINNAITLVAIGV